MQVLQYSYQFPRICVKQILASKEVQISFWKLIWTAWMDSIKIKGRCFFSLHRECMKEVVFHAYERFACAMRMRNKMCTAWVMSVTYPRTGHNRCPTRCLHPQVRGDASCVARACAPHVCVMCCGVMCACLRLGRQRPPRVAFQPAYRVSVH